MKLKLFQLGLVLSIILNIIAAVTLSRTLPGKEKKVSPNTELPFLSKRIFVENQNDIIINFVPLRIAVREYVKKQKEKIGIYFEYLPTGNSIGVNDTMEVRFASLIKIPVVMAVYKEIEHGNLKLDTVLTVQEENLHDGFGDLWKKGEGTKITVKEAIELSLIKSDNTALRVLVSSLPKNAIESVFDNLDIIVDKGNGYPIISPKNYTSILKSLYLSSYLLYEDSNEILDLLTKTDFNDKIASGIDPAIKIAHKIGTFDVGENERVFSDCGIVYVPNRPYALCIMVNSDEEKSREHMIYLSKMVYGYIERVSRN